MVRNGVERRGGATVADGSTGAFGLLCCSLWRADWAMPGAARLGKTRCGMIRSGEAIAADSSKEALRLPCCSLWRGQTWLVPVR